MTGQAAGVGDTARDRADKFWRGVASGDPGKYLAFATFRRLPVTCRMPHAQTIIVNGISGQTEQNCRVAAAICRRPSRLREM
jgi:hypothetical protein